MARLFATSSTDPVVLFAILRRTADGFVYSVASEGFVEYDAADFADYCVPFEDAGGGLHAADVPDGVGAGSFIYVVRRQAGASPAEDDTIIKTAPITVSGSGEGNNAGPFLSTVTKVKRILGIASDDTSLDDVLEAHLAAATTVVQNYTGRQFVYGSFTEYFDGNALGLNGGYVSLSNTPISEITSLTFNPDSDSPEVFGGDQMNVDVETGYVQFRRDADYVRQFTQGFKRVSISYSGGYETIPSAVDTATAMLASTMYSQSKMNPALSSERLGQYSYTIASAGAGGSASESDKLFTPGVKAILARYRRVPAL